MGKKNKVKVNRYSEAYRLVDDGESYIGDDLTQEDLDDIWAALAGSYNSIMGSWWQDKPHRIGIRLLLRLTRAEQHNAELKGELELLRRQVSRLENQGTGQ